MLRNVSVLLRIWQQEKRKNKVLQTFNAYKQIIDILPAYQKKETKVLIIRLDDIGDYLLFRNSLSFYKNSKLWNTYSITLLGNIVWKELFDSFDRNTVENTIWIDKKKYFADNEYRFDIWKQLRNAGFETVVCASRTRPLLLDDICMLATGAIKNIGSKNTMDERSLNSFSDGLYSALFEPSDHFDHEFFFNVNFANWFCKTSNVLSQPQIKLSSQNRNFEENYIVLFIGASAGSKRWPAKRWMELIELIKKEKKIKIFITGGENEFVTAKHIAGQTGAENIAGKLSLSEMAHVTSNTKAVITNDSMELHMGASCNVPTIVIANGSKAYRFTDYEKVGITNIKAVYPRIFLDRYHKKGNDIYENYIPVTADIATIKAQTVFDLLENIIQ
jgi:ADP-heptose:LPS heptosyltransferase